MLPHSFIIIYIMMFLVTSRVNRSIPILIFVLLHYSSGLFDHNRVSDKQNHVTTIHLKPQPNSIKELFERQFGRSQSNNLEGVQVLELNIDNQNKPALKPNQLSVISFGNELIKQQLSNPSSVPSAADSQNFQRNELFRIGSQNPSQNVPSIQQTPALNPASINNERNLFLVGEAPNNNNGGNSNPTVFNFPTFNSAGSHVDSSFLNIHSATPITFNTEPAGLADSFQGSVTLSSHHSPPNFLSDNSQNIQTHNNDNRGFDPFNNVASNTDHSSTKNSNLFQPGFLSLISGNSDSINGNSNTIGGHIRRFNSDSNSFKNSSNLRASPNSFESSSNQNHFISNRDSNRNEQKARISAHSPLQISLSQLKADNIESDLFNLALNSGFRQNGEFPFDPSFPGPPTPDRYQPPIGGSCIAFTGERGLCLGISKCPSLRPLVKQLHNRDLLTTLLNNVCRFEDGNVYFCCEFPAFQAGEVELNDDSEPAFKKSPYRASLPGPGQCGQRNERRGKIIGGESADPNEFPWTVAVGRPANDRTFLVDCAGAIITRRHVLTAAICFLFPEFFQATHVRVAEHDPTAYDVVQHEDYVIVGRNDPGYLAPTTQNNLIILTVGRDIEFNQYVRPVCLPSLGNEIPRENSRVTLAGWGLNRLPGSTVDDGFEGSGEERPETNVLQTIQQRVLPLTSCQEAYSDPTRNFRIVDHRNVCIRREDQDGICVGDGGGPIVQRQSDDSYVLVGVISTTAGCLGEALPSLATRVSTYMEWINYVIQGP